MRFFLLLDMSSISRVILAVDNKECRAKNKEVEDHNEDFEK